MIFGAISGTACFFRELDPGQYYNWTLSRSQNASNLSSEGLPSFWQKIGVDSEGFMLPGSKNPMFKVSGPKYHEGYGFWNQRPQMLGI